jgi:hypothetical protein
MRKFILAVGSAALLSIASIGTAAAGGGLGPPESVPSLCKFNSPGPGISSDARANGGIRGGRPGHYVAFEIPCNPLYDDV